MNKVLINVLIIILFGGIGFFLIPLHFWYVVHSGLLTSFSVIAGAVMVRLARGLPFTNADQFDSSEIRKVSDTIKSIMRAMSWLIFISLFAMFFFSSIEIITDFAKDNKTASSFLSSFSTVLVVFVFIRIFQLVKGDYSLVEVQSRFMIRAVERKEDKELKKDIIKTDDSEEKERNKFENPTGYGTYSGDL